MWVSRTSRDLSVLPDGSVMTRINTTSSRSSTRARSTPTNSRESWTFTSTSWTLRRDPARTRTARCRAHPPHHAPRRVPSSFVPALGRLTVHLVTASRRVRAGASARGYETCRERAIDPHTPASGSVRAFSGVTGARFGIGRPVGTVLTVHRVVPFLSGTAADPDDPLGLWQGCGYHEAGDTRGPVGRVSCAGHWGCPIARRPRASGCLTDRGR